MRFSAGPDRVHQRHAPLLGEHNPELLAELGLSPSELEALEAAGVIGQGLRSAAGAT
jgi:crotonobetainyl-CoA:carnitine CoA-transferase CaiB-like acyl-CoA transferase